MVSLQLEKAVLKEKVKTCEDLSSFLKDKDVDQDVLELINEFKGLLSAKKSVNKVDKKKTVSKDGKKKKPPSFWNNFLKENMPIVRDEQKGLKEGDEGWIEKEGRWEMSEIAKRGAKFKQQDDFKEKEREYKQSLTDLSSDDNNDNADNDVTDDNDITDDEIQTKKQPKKQAKKQAKKQPKKQAKKQAQKQQEIIDTDSDDDSDNDDDNGLAKVQPVVEENHDSDDGSDNDSDDGSEPDDDSDNDSDDE